jgi:hypothetical protein
MRHRTYLLIVMALGEGGAGLILLVWPTILLALLLGVDQVSTETSFFARIAGAALLALSVGWWLGRCDKPGPAQRGLVLSVLTYDLAAVVILAYTALFVHVVGIALWPAVLVHAALAVWCIVCLWAKPRDQDVGTRADLQAVKHEAMKG